MKYYAIQVRTGSESIVAVRLNALSKRVSQIKKAFIPMEITKEIDLAGKDTDIYLKQRLLFQGYVFVELEELTPEIFQLIRSVSSSVYTVIETPIEEAEIRHLINDRIALTTEVSKDSKLDDYLEKLNALNEQKKMKSGNKRPFLLFGKSNKRTISFPDSYFSYLAEETKLTFQQLKENLLSFLQVVMDYEAADQ